MLQQLIDLFNQLAASNGFAPLFSAALGACAMP
jgi:hypothetical protein